MTSETALKINSAACRVYMFREGLIRRLEVEDMERVKQCSVAQIQSAVERVEAINRDSRSKIVCVLAADVIPGVKAFASKFKAQ